MEMQTRRLGGVEVSAVGLGCMGMSGSYGPADEDESIATIHAAMEAGITLLNTGDFYGAGHNEMLVGRALAGKRDRAFVSVKFGAQLEPPGRHIGFDARPAAVKTALTYTLRRLRTDYVDLYQPARVDPNVPIEETVGAIKEMIDAGYIRHLGLSEAGVESIRRAHAVHPVIALETEYALATRDPEREVLPVLRELGIGLVAYGVLSRGLLSGDVTPGGLAPTDWRSHSPRFQGENLQQNLRLVDALRQVGEQTGLTPAQLAFAWVLSRGDDIVPLIGTKRRERLAEALGALDAHLTADDLALLERAVPADAVAGTRYPAAGMASLGR
ncbi:MAG: aldo/keto reductase [Gemmatimonadetes bacterium]|nr:aldo/keto reductase [Gemmatimonadota bacterium]